MNRLSLCSKATQLSIMKNLCRYSTMGQLRSRSALEKFENPRSPSTPLAKPSLPTVTTIRTQADHKAHSHVSHWTAERVMTLALTASIPAAIVLPYPGLEYLLAVCLTVHSHWGMESIVVDYLRPAVVGNAVSKASVGSVYVLSMLTLGALFYFIYTDVGLINAVKLLWKV